MAETEPEELTGGVDERVEQLAALDGANQKLSAAWLRRQLDSALRTWAGDETKLDIEAETHVDY